VRFFSGRRQVAATLDLVCKSLTAWGALTRAARAAGPISTQSCCVRLVFLPSGLGPGIDHRRTSHDVTTTNDIAGQRVVRYLGVVRGITVRSRSIVGNIGAMIQALFGGNIRVYTLTVRAGARDAFAIMVAHGQQLGANAVIAMRTTPMRSRPHYRGFG